MNIERAPATAPVRAAYGRQGAVASPHRLATQAGLATLRAGGSAVDAAIATNAALAVVAGHSCGLGGDALWVIWDTDAQEALTLNGSGRSGSLATIEAVRADGHATMPLRGRWSVNVPGAVHSWGLAHERFGRLPWAHLLAASIELAEGFAATPGWLDAVERAVAWFGETGDWAAVYRPDGRARSPGDAVRLPALARTLRLLADEGPDAPYRGSLTREMAGYLEARGVPITTDDLAAHRSDWGRPLAIPYRDATSLSHAPNSVGITALQTLGVLDRHRAPAADAFDGRGWNDAPWVHLGLEASRLALAERDAWVTDPGWMADDAVAEMLSPRRLDRLAAAIDPGRAMRPVRPTLPGGGGTVYLAAADAQGQLVSLLQSNYLGFGSGLVDPGTGIAFHDRGAFFSLDPGHPNALAPGKRTAHTLSPGLLLRSGRPWVVHGSMGGEIQPQVFAQVVSALVDGGADVATAVAAPRWAALMREQHGPPEISLLEARAPEHLGSALAAMGHSVTVTGPWDELLGHAHAIEVRYDGDGVAAYAAASDPRCEGLAAAW